jgi:hypothetical protein
MVVTEIEKTMQSDDEIACVPSAHGQGQEREHSFK